MTEPSCLKCKGDSVYEDGNLWVCPECDFEWSRLVSAPAPEATPDAPAAVRDAHGTALADGDAVIVLKDLKVKGSSAVVKGGTKVRNIRLVEDATDGHNIACRVDGIGEMNLKSEFVRKA